MVHTVTMIVKTHNEKDTAFSMTGNMNTRENIAFLAPKGQNLVSFQVGDNHFQE